MHDNTNHSKQSTPKGVCKQTNKISLWNSYNNHAYKRPRAVVLNLVRGTEPHKFHTLHSSNPSQL